MAVIEIKKTSVVKNIFFSVIVSLSILTLLEWGAFRVLKKYYPNDIWLNLDPILGVDHGRIRVRENLFRKKINLYRVGSENLKKKNTPTIKSITGWASFDSKEGLISSAIGDEVINKWGFRGPFFEKKKSPKIFRIVSMGGSTTMGYWTGNELTYPRILERMLNNHLNKNLHYQVINAGTNYHNSCDLKLLFSKDVVNVDPDLILIMTGWNDSNSLRDSKVHSIAQYCASPASPSSLKKFHLFRLLQNWISLVADTGPRQNLGYEIFEKNLNFLKTNLEEIIHSSLEKGIQVGLISLPTPIDRRSSMKELKGKYPQYNSTDVEELEYQKKFILTVNNLYKELSKKYDDVFYVNSGISLNSRGKTKFFSDIMHQTEAGNRIQAFGVYKQLNERFKIHPIKTVPFKDEIFIDENQLELEYLKSIFAANEIEDLSYSGCVSFHQKCDVTVIGFSHYKRLTSIIEFSLGSLLQFKEEVKTPKMEILLGELLLQAIKVDPDFSLSYWVLSVLKKNAGQNIEAGDLLKKAYQLNPELRSFDFEEEYKNFQNKKRFNPFIEKLEDFVSVLKRAPNNIATYTYYWAIVKSEDFSDQKTLPLLLSTYYANPLLARSIFDYTLKRLGEHKESEAILFLISKIRPLKPEYNFSEHFSLDRFHKN